MGCCTLLYTWLVKYYILSRVGERDKARHDKNFISNPSKIIVTFYMLTKLRIGTRSETETRYIESERVKTAKINLKTQNEAWLHDRDTDKNNVIKNKYKY